MLSKRNFFTITTMMAVLLFLFQFSSVIKESWNDYGVNQYSGTEDSPLTSEDVYKLSESAAPGRRKVVYIGNQQDQAVGSVVEEWCVYTKRHLDSYESLEAYLEKKEDDPEAVILDSGYLKLDTDTRLLQALTAEGVNLIFCNLPEVGELSKHQQLRKLLGIQGILEQETELTGVHLFSGFLLGGESRYIAQTEKEEKRQDLDLEIPWYATLSGTKTYMVGLLENEEVENEYLPAIIWRNSIGSAKVFAVNGDYMNDSTGIGILDAMMAELHPYEIYPVVNAQNLVLVNYPGLASENGDEMEKRYSQSQKAVFRDIIWPGIVAVAEHNDAKITAMMAPQMDYEDGNEPDANELTYYMKLLREQEAETGISGASVSNTPLEEKFSRDGDFLSANLPDYSFLSLYLDKTDISRLDVKGQTGFLKAVRTICRKYDKEGPLLSYAGSQVTCQKATIDGISHTYSEDLRVKSLETALGYSSIMLDLSQVAFPKSDADSWEKWYEAFSSNTNTYWNAFRSFEQTTLAESDKRIRSFLAMDYASAREHDKILLDISNNTGESWFILRLNGEEIDSIEGASYQKIEDGAYLLRTEQDRVKIMVKQEEELFYHNH